MFIKFKFNQTSRKIKKDIKTIEELKQEALAIFGDKVTYCDYLYEDEDLELVNIIEDIDLENCYEEAEENGSKSIKIFLELSSPKTKRARSISQKKKGVVINEDNNEILEIVKNKFESENDSSDFEEINLDSDDSEGKSVDSKVMRKMRKLQQKLKRKMQKLRGKKRGGRHHKGGRGKGRGKGMPDFVRNKLDEKRGKSRSKSNKNRRGNQGRCNRGQGKGMPEFVKDIIEENKKHGNPWKQIKKAINQATEEVKCLRGSPELLAKFVEKLGESLSGHIQATVEAVKTENPELFQALTEKKEKNKKQKEEKREAGIARRLERQQKKQANGQVRERMQILIPIFKETPRPELRKKVIQDIEAGKDIQATIKDLMA